MDKFLIIFGALVLIVFGPFFTIWALNTLFPVLNIPYTFETWVAVCLMTPIVSGGWKSVKKD